MKKWFVSAKRADFTEIGKKFNITPMTARIIRNRDVIGDEQIRKFLHGGIADLYSPWQLYGMKEGTRLLQQAIAAGEKIRIIGDYDIDGVCATYILLTGLKKVGANVDTVIPDRIKDGYGINEQLIDRAKEDHVHVIVTCDNGIAALSQITYAKELGMKVLVTDHHEVPFEENENGRMEKLPPADVIINPKQERCTYPWKGLCGGVVAWKLVAALYEIYGVASEEVYKLLEFAAIATVGDIMELQDENRIIVKEGLKRIHHTKNIGLRSLIEVNGLERDSIGAYHIGFVLGPCINAGGRLDTAKRALELFASEDKEAADRLAGDLKALNDNRKDMTAVAVEEAIRQVEETELKRYQVLVIYLPECHESLAGIVAGRIRERYYKPTFILTNAEEGMKGSGRSIDAYHMYEELNKCKHLLTKFGGHKLAAGLSLETRNLEELRRTLNQNAKLSEDDLTPKVSIDMQLPFAYVSEELVEQLELLEPFGKGNTKPIFVEKDLDIINTQVFGKNQNVLKMRVKDSSGRMMDATYFGDTASFLAYYDERKGQKAAFTYYPTINEYQGRKNLQIIVQSFR